MHIYGLAVKVCAGVWRYRSMALLLHLPTRWMVYVSNLVRGSAIAPRFLQLL